MDGQIIVGCFFASFLGTTAALVFVREMEAWRLHRRYMAYLAVINARLAAASVRPRDGNVVQFEPPGAA